MVNGFFHKKAASYIFERALNTSLTIKTLKQHEKNTGKYGSQKTPYFDTFHAVLRIEIKKKRTWWGQRNKLQLIPEHDSD